MEDMDEEMGPEAHSSRMMLPSLLRAPNK